MRSSETPGSGCRTTPDLPSQCDSAERAGVLTVSGIGKTYAEPVLADVTLDLRAGEVLALTGENGAGKSTLSKIVGGLVTPTTGTMTLGGAPYAPASRSDAEALGVRMVMQELNLLPTLSVAENLFLNRLPQQAAVRLDRPRASCARTRVTRWRKSGSTRSIPDTPVGALGIGHQQMVEIARNLIGDCRVLILDEPTAMLTAREVDLLFEQVERLKARGVALVYISHRLEELKRIARARGGAARRPAGARRRDGRTDERPARHADGRARHRRADRSRRAPHRRRRAEGGRA